MVRYARIINGKFVAAPKMLAHDDMVTYNPQDELLRNAGFLPVVWTPSPDDALEGFYYEAGFEERDGRIYRTWTLKEVPKDEA